MKPSTPHPSISSVSSSASSCVTVIPARTSNSNHNIEKSHTNSKNDTNLSSKEIDPEESISKRDSFPDDDDSVHRNSVDLASLLSAENSQHLNERDHRINSDYTTISDSSTCDENRHTLTDGEELQLTDISVPPSETSESTAVESEYDYGSINSERNSYREPNEESYNVNDLCCENDDIYLTSEHKHPLVESGYDSNNETLVENIRYYSTIIEESEEDESLVVPSSEAFGLKLKMGQYYSSNSGGADRNDKKKKKDNDNVNECRTSRTSSDGWRLSQTSSNSNVSSSTGGGDSDDTLGQNMSELSSINSHLSQLGQTSDDFKSLDRKEVYYSLQDSKNIKDDPDATPIATPIAPKRKSNTIIKNAIDELESIEQAAQHLLQQSQTSPRSRSRKNMNSSSLQTNISAEIQNIKREIPTGKQIEHKTNNLNGYHILNHNETNKTNVQNMEKKAKEDIIFDNPDKVPPMEIKRRQWTKCTQLKPFISRESYNEDDFIKEIESLRGSYRESDLNDFLDRLESSGVKNSLDESQYEQLIADIKADAERPNSNRGSRESLQMQTNIDKKVIRSSQESLTSKSKSPTVKRFERFKERILELVHIKSKSKIRHKNSDTVSKEANGVNKSMVVSTSQPIDLELSIADDQESKINDSQTLEVKDIKTTVEHAKSEYKRGFKLTEFLKGSPKLSRKKNGGDTKTDKQDVLLSDNQIKDLDIANKNLSNILSKSNDDLPNTSENKKSPTSSQELKKEVRFKLELEEVSSDTKEPVVKVCQPCNSSQTVRELSSDIDNKNIGQKSLASNKEYKDTSKKEIILPATVTEINKMNELREDANSRAESLLPKLPERIKPPRRKKRKNLIPASVEIISLDSFESLSQKSSDDSSAASPKNSSIFEKEIILEDKIEAALASQIEKEKLPDVKKYDHEQLSKIKPFEQQRDRIISNSVGETSNNTLEKNHEKLLDSQTIDLPNKANKILSSHLEGKLNPEKREETSINIDSSEVIEEKTTNVIRKEITPHKISVPSIAIKCIDGNINETTDKKQKNNSFIKDKTPEFPETDETMSSFYDNVNPYYEVMSKLEEEVEDVASYFESKQIQEKDGIKLEFKVIDRIKSFEEEIALKNDSKAENAKKDNVFYPLENTKPNEYTYQQNETENLINFSNIVGNNINEIGSSHQEALLSPENENKAFCIDDLNILTEEIARIANDMERDMLLQNQDAEYVQDQLINKVQNNYGQHNENHELCRQQTAAMFTQAETTGRKAKRKNEIASQTDAEFDETESELDDATFSRDKQRQTNPFFGPSTSYSRSETLVSSSERNLEIIPPNKMPPSVPPRHFQQKMPLNVVKELKSVLSENGEESRLKKPELPPRWDSILTFNNGRCISDVSNNSNDNNGNNNNNNKLSNSSLHETSNVNSGQVSVSAADPQSEQPLISFLSSNNVTPSNLITSSVIKYTKHNCNETVDGPKTCSELENLAPILVETFSTIDNSIQEKDYVQFQPSFLREILGYKNSKNPSQKISIRRVRANVYPFFDSHPQVSVDNTPVPLMNNKHCLKLNSSIEEGYMSDPGPLNKQHIKNSTVKFGSVTDCDVIESSKNNVISDINKCKIDIFRPEITTLNNNIQKATCSYIQLPPRPPLPLEIKLLYNSDSAKSKLTDAKRLLSIPEINLKESPIFLRKKNLNQEIKQKPRPLSSDSYILNTSQTSCQENIYSFVDSRLQSISLSVHKPNEEDLKEENNKVVGNPGTLPENKQTCNILRQRPLTWCTQSDFNASYMLRTQTSSENNTYKTNIENPLLNIEYNEENPHSNPSSQLSQCSSQRLQAQGLGEWLFLARLDHTNQLLSQLNFAMQLQLDRSPGELSEYNEKFIQNSEKSSSPPPPPRPRTPIDERDPEQVYSERRYLSYFEGGPRAKHPLGDEPPKPPTYQQVAAQKRYANYFIGPPQANPEKLRFSSPDLENDTEVLEAKRRYDGYFKSGPPRPKSYNEPERPAEDDAITLQAKERYDSYFKSNISHTRSGVSEEKSVEPDEAQLAAEKRYLSYFQSGPPRSRSTISEDKFLEADEVQKAAEKRYLSYFHPGPPRNRTTVSEEKSTELDEEQKAAEKRYLSYFQPGPLRPRSYVEDTGPQEPDEEQIEAGKRYAKYFEGLPKAKHEQSEEIKRPKITAEMVAAEERFLKYFDPIPYGAPKKIVQPPPPSEEEMKKKQLFLEFQEALESRVCRKQMKIVKVSKPKKEHDREKTPPTLRDIVVGEFLQRVQDRKKEKDLHFGDTDDEDEEEDITKALPKTVTTDEPIIQGGGTVDRRISCDLQLFVKEEELQQLEIAESNLLNEIEQVLGFGIRLTEDGRVRKGASKPDKTADSRAKRYPTDVHNDYISKQREVWTPGGFRDEKITDGPSKIEASDLPSFKDVPPVWTPARAGSASPSFGRKEYKKLHFEGSTLHRKTSQENVNLPRPEESFAWKDREAERLKSALPRVQSPTVTLLQKKREGQIPGHRPDYMQQEEAYYKPGDKLYTIKREYESEDEEAGSRKFAVLGPRKIEGVGPTTRDGVPVSLKSGVKSEHQGEWYRRMFDSLHKVRDEDYIVIKYKSPKARYGGYMSEPEGYDSDIGSSRYISLDRRNKKFEVDVAETHPKNTKRYIHQPGRIENYIPGFSSLSEKELRDNPEADVKLEIKTKESAPVTSSHRFGSSRMQMSNALKDTGYESDSTLVFRKREDQRRKFLDPKNSSVIYKQVQLGGEIPLTGLQKPAPPRPKESPYKYNSSEVNIHYRTPVRVEQKESLSEEELARRQEEHMKKVYENERRKKYLAELEDIERRRHTDNFTPLQKSPIPLNRYDDETFGGPIGAKTPEPKQVARALFNFSAQNKRELSFNKGDIVTIRRCIDRNWYEGEVRGVVGIFPCNYVEVVPFDSLKTLGRRASEGQARTRFNFQAQTAMEMSLTKGEMVILTRRVDENWYEGRVGNRRGIFPVTYVDVMAEPGSDRPISPSRDPMPRPALPAAHLLYNGTSGVSSPYSTMGHSLNHEHKAFTQLTVNTQQDSVPYRALYNYKPQNEDELELIEGDIVLVMEKCDDGWFVGTSKRTGLFGTFPGNYVERC